MKRLILTILTAGALTSGSAQLFSPESLNGALLGTVIGGIAGGNCHHGFSGSGAAIGAGVGLLAGAVGGEVQRQNYYASQPYYYLLLPCASLCAAGVSGVSVCPATRISGCAGAPSVSAGRQPGLGPSDTGRAARA